MEKKAHLCACGCGQETKMVTRNQRKGNYMKGDYNKFIVGHSNKGKPAWNKGKKGLQVAWNKDLTKETDERVMKYSKSLIGSHPNENTRRKLSESHMGEKNYNFGKPRLEEHRKNIGDGNRGKIIPLKTKRKMRKKANERWKRPGEREKVSDSVKEIWKRPGYRENMSGEKSPSWLNGKSFEPYTLDFNKRFKESIKERDFHCCQMCNLGEEDLLLLKRYLVIHHIDYNKLLTIPHNCITLCNKCNAIVNFNRKQWTEFFQSLLKERHNYQYTQDQKVILNYTEEIKNGK